MQAFILGAKITSLIMAAVFGLFYLNTSGGEVSSREVIAILEGTGKTKAARYLVFNDKAYSLPEAMYLDGVELFYRMKKGDVIKVVVDNNDFIASLHVYGKQVYTIEDYADWKVRRKERWLNLSKWFLMAFVFFYFVSLRARSK